MSARYFAVVIAIVAFEAPALAAQCPDGSPPPCSPRRDSAKAVRRATLRTAPDGSIRLTAIYKDVPLRTIRMELSELTRRMLLATPAADSVQITVRVDDQPWETALRAILLASGLDAVKDENGITLIKTRREAALVAVKRIVPDSVRALYQRGVAEQHRRTPEGYRESLRLLRRAIDLDSGFAEAWSALARTAQLATIRTWDVVAFPKDSLLALAVRASRRAVELDSGLAGSWVVLARVAQGVDPASRTATLHALRRAIALDSTNVEAWFELGLAFEELLRPAAAETAWQRAVTLSPTHLESLAFLAIHFRWAHDYARARLWADSALALDATFSLARSVAAEIALLQNRLDDAERHAEVERRSARGSEPALPLAILARAALKRGAMADAQRYLAEAERSADIQHPTRHEAAELGAAWAAFGDTARALRWLSAYAPLADLHYQVHLKRDEGLAWLTALKSPLLLPLPAEP